MDDALFVAASGLDSVERMLDNSAHNAVNSNTPGYQSRRVIFQNFGSLLKDAGDRSHLIGVREVVAFEQGELIRRDDPLAVALEGDGFLRVRDEAGREYLTRNGDLTVRTDGRLSTRSGFTVLDDGGAPIEFPRGIAGVEIDREGRLIQDGAVLGRLGVVELSEQDRARLEPASETLFSRPDDAKLLPATATAVRQGFLEMPRYTGPKGLVGMLLASRNHEAMQRAIRALDRMHEASIREVS